MKKIARLPVWWQLFIGLACCFLFSLIVICASFFIDIKEAEKNNWSYLHRMNSQWELEIEKEYEDEQKAIDDIEKELSVDIPRFLYRPEGLKFKDYNISKDFEYALLQYDYNDTIMTLYINKYDKETKSTGASLDGKEIETIKLPEGEASIQVKRIMAKGDKKASYVAYWNNSTEFYQIESQMEEKEFIKLIKNIKF